LGHWDVDRLNRILKKDFPEFSGVPVSYTAAKNGVHLYRVTYSSVIPERANKTIVATGLIAIPDSSDNKSYPMLSYQHGTVYGKTEVPSFPDESPETQLMLAQFGGQGYIVIGADYFGMGSSKEPEGYMVKASHQQATYDMLMASRAVLQHLKVDTSELFLGGWSQGGFVTMALAERLEKEAVKVSAAATASAPLDVSALLNGFLNFPRSIDAAWVNSVIILSSFAFENYYGVPGLARSVISDDYYEISRKAYEREPFNAADVPTDLRRLIKAEYFDPQFFAESAYGRLAAETTAYRWIYKSPIRNYYGEADEVISVGVGRLAMTYQQGIGNGNPNVTAISTGKTNHRGTYAVSVPEWKKWFDSLRASN
jgi:pimeloyl-ACP methyl ester carboxylesterase